MFLNMKNINLTHQSPLFKQNIFLLLNPMTEFSGAGDKTDFDGNTLFQNVKMMNMYTFPDARFSNSRRMIKL